jgi:ubiquinone/menaquinone biosynthesis C-methylase UbiE
MAYTAFDRFVAWRRFRAATPHIRNQARVCDLGCGAGPPFLHHIESRLKIGIGLDKYIGESKLEKISVIHANITVDLPLESEQFNHVTMLAVLEHLVEPENVLAEAYRLLLPGGSLIMTWPSSAVDPVLEILTRIKLVNDELGFDQHQPRIPIARLKVMLQRIGFVRIENGKFEFGLNNWLVALKES